jgi:DNA-binding transcriptional LysR family regulator
MDWNALKSFLAIAEQGSLSAAAVSLGVNHSTMFRRLQTFEQELGGRLFERLNNRYVLTPMGDELLVHARQASGVFDDIERSLVGKDVQPSGVVTITAPYNLATRYLPRALADFRLSYPEIEIELLSSNQMVNMNSRLADIALRVCDNPPEHLVGRKVASIPWGIFTADTEFLSKEHFSKEASGKNSRVSVDELAEYQLIGGAGLMQNLAVFSWLEKHFPNQISTRCDELTAMSYFAQGQQGLAFLPLDQAREGIMQVGQLPVSFNSELWILLHPDLRKVERMRLVMEHLTGYFSEVGFRSGLVG